MEIAEYKRNVLSKLLVLARAKEQAFKVVSRDTQHRANEEEGAMQSRYSTFKEEGQYLAGGLKLIHNDFKSIVATIELALNGVFRNSKKIEAQSIVELEFEDGSTTKLFVFSVMGGEKIDDLLIISPTAPLCRAIILKEVGDQFSLQIGNKIKKGEVTNVQ